MKRIKNVFLITGIFLLTIETKVFGLSDILNEGQQYLVPESNNEIENMYLKVEPNKYDEILNLIVFIILTIFVVFSIFYLRKSKNSKTRKIIVLLIILLIIIGSFEVAKLIEPQVMY